MGYPPKQSLGRALTAPLLLFSLASTFIFLGIAAWEMITAVINLNHYFLGKGTFEAIMAPFDGNAATPFLVLLAMIAGCVTISGYLVGFYHLVSWTAASASAAQAAAWISFGFLWLPFVMTWLQVHLAGHIGEKSQVIAAFAVITTFLHAAYTTTLHL